MFPLASGCWSCCCDQTPLFPALGRPVCEFRDFEVKMGSIMRPLGSVLEQSHSCSSQATGMPSFGKQQTLLT